VASNVKEAKALSIATALVQNAFSIPKALQSIGYSESTIAKKGRLITETPLVLKYLNKLQQRQAIRTDYSVDWLQSEHRRLAALAEEKGDLATATQNIAFIGKTIGGYSENVNINDNHQVVIVDSTIKDYARQIAASGVKALLGGSQTTNEAEFVNPAQSCDAATDTTIVTDSTDSTDQPQPKDNWRSTLRKWDTEKREWYYINRLTKERVNQPESQPKEPQQEPAQPLQSAQTEPSSDNP